MFGVGFFFHEWFCRFRMTRRSGQCMSVHRHYRKSQSKPYRGAAARNNRTNAEAQPKRLHLNSSLLIPHSSLTLTPLSTLHSPLSTLHSPLSTLRPPPAKNRSEKTPKNHLTDLKFDAIISKLPALQALFECLTEAGLRQLILTIYSRGLRGCYRRRPFHQEGVR